MSKRSLNRAAIWAGLVFLVAAPLGAGCSKPAGGDGDAAVAGDDVGTGTPSDASTPDTGTGVGDAGTPDTGPELVPCSYDDDCGPTERCGDNGACMPAAACDTPANCTPSDDNDLEHLYCENATVGLGCRCVKAVGAAEGYCKRRLPPCAPCETDEQCGSDPLWFKTPLHEPGKCVTLDGAKVCLEPYVTGKCGCGQSASIDTAHYCAPQGATPSCADGGAFLCCQKDANCPPEHPLCDTATGRCQDLCWYDYEKHETVGCRADKVCNVDPKYLTPSSRNYGAGRCGPPCAFDGDCSYIRGDFVCKAEPGSDKRCRPPGCLADLECPQTEPQDPYKGYCDRSSGVCSGDCRTGTDPVTALDFVDCKEGYKCEEPTPGAPGQCLEKNCIENGGAQLYCNWNEMCCGEDRDGDVDTDPEPCTDPTGAVVAEKGKCYRAPNPPWCAPCDAQDVKSCMGKPGFPSSTKDYNLCIGFGPDGAGTDRGDSCMFACSTPAECPKGYFCQDIPVDCTQDASLCGDPARCQDSGKKDTSTNPPTPILWCKCSTAGDKSECPLLDPNTADGPQARCSDDKVPSNYPWLHCIWIHGCYPYSTACMPPAP